MKGVSENRISFLQVLERIKKKKWKITRKTHVRECGRYAKSWGFSDIVTDRVRTTPVPGQTKNKFNFPLAPSSPIPSGLMGLSLACSGFSAH